MKKEKSESLPDFWTNIMTECFQVGGMSGVDQAKQNM